MLSRKSVQLLVWLFVLGILPPPHAQPEDLENGNQQLVQSIRELRTKRKAELTDQEKAADLVLFHLKRRYHRVPRAEFPPALPFHVAWELYQEAPLNQILREMPKGCLLNADPLTSGSYDLLLRFTYDPKVCLYVEPQNPSDPESPVAGALRRFAGTPPPGWISVDSLRIRAGIAQRYDASLLQLVTIGREDLTLPSLRDEVFRSRARIEPLFDYAPFYRAHLLHLCQQQARRGVQMIEFRTELKGRELADGRRDDDEADLLRWFDLADSLDTLPGGMEIRLVITAGRQATPDEVRARYARAVELNRKYPGMIIGFDLQAKRDRDPELQPFVTLLQEERDRTGFRALPLILSLHPASPVQQGDLLDALRLNAVRVGNATTLPHSSILMKEYADRSVVVELSPILDQVTGTVADLRFHPGQAMVNHGLHVVIAPGQTGVLGARLSDSWFAAILAWDLDIADIKSMIQTSFRASGLTDLERDRVQAIWQEQWTGFIQALSQVPLPRD